MPGNPTPVPSAVVAHAAVTQQVLDGLLGQTVTDYCGKYGSVGDTINHCAHFVSHVLDLRIPGAALCSNVGNSTYTYEERRNGVCVRVNQVYNSCNGRAAFDAAVTCHTPRIIVATIADNVRGDNPPVVGDHPRKHIGFLLGTNVYHYSNTRDAVVCQPVGEFASHYGSRTVLYVSDLP
ncbi:MAG: hypothetical protein K5872_04255 [Rhizobiaceae bacterium]|nr:hypothetical protein [Rhizobiaceae bacterium]MCV0405423.1 hypothetical protein [Rhizobiaceae bacterium]